MTTTSLQVNRAPVLTLWAAVVAERLGHSRDEALSLGRAVAGLNAQSKGRRLGIYEAKEEPARKAPAKQAAARARTVELLGRQVPVARTAHGDRALLKDEVIESTGVERYLGQKFGAALGDVTDAMRALAKSYAPRQLGEVAYTLYERFRPGIPEGVRGWGAKGTLDLARIRGMAERAGEE